MLNKITVLKEYFGHSTFRFGQELVVDAILQRRDVRSLLIYDRTKSKTPE